MANLAYINRPDMSYTAFNFFFNGDYGAYVTSNALFANYPIRGYDANKQTLLPDIIQILLTLQDNKIKQSDIEDDENFKELFISALQHKFIIKDGKYFKLTKTGKDYLDSFIFVDFFPNTQPIF